MPQELALRHTDLPTVQLLLKSIKIVKIQIRLLQIKTEFVDLQVLQQIHQMGKQDYWLVRTLET